MTKFLSALIVLFSIAALACGESTEQADRASVNASPPLPAADGTVTPPDVAVVEFRKRVDAYVKIHNEAEGKVPNLKLTDDPKEIADREKALAEMIMTLRAGAQIGDIFAPEYQPYFIKIVQDDFKLRSAADRKALVAELPKNVKVDVNTIYPTTLPLETFPAALLRKLPDLPPELEYRIVSRTLLLRDVKANLIVDILRDVVPTIPS
jgi:hypothetical protein